MTTCQAISHFCGKFHARSCYHTKHRVRKDFTHLKFTCCKSFFLAIIHGRKTQKAARTCSTSQRSIFQQGALTDLEISLQPFKFCSQSVRPFQQRNRLNCLHGGKGPKVQVYSEKQGVWYENSWKIVEPIGSRLVKPTREATVKPVSGKKAARYQWCNAVIRLGFCLCGWEKKLKNWGVRWLVVK